MEYHLEMNTDSRDLYEVWYDYFWSEFFPYAESHNRRKMERVTIALSNFMAEKESSRSFSRINNVRFTQVRDKEGIDSYTTKVKQGSSGSFDGLVKVRHGDNFEFWLVGFNYS